MPSSPDASRCQVKPPDAAPSESRSTLSRLPSGNLLSRSAWTAAGPRTGSSRSMSFHSTAALHSAATAAGDTTPLGSIKRLRIRESHRTAGAAISASEDGRLRSRSDTMGWSCWCTPGAGPRLRQWRRVCTQVGGNKGNDMSRTSDVCVRALTVRSPSLSTSAEGQSNTRWRQAAAAVPRKDRAVQALRARRPPT